MLDKLTPPVKVKKREFEQALPELQNRLRSIEQASLDAGIPVAIIFEGWQAAWVKEISHNIAETLVPNAKLHSITTANREEQLYPWLWRFWRKLPGNGEWAIYDRSWYWRVLYERLEEGLSERVWRRNYRDILEFERTLTDGGLVLVKFFLHLPKQNLKRRLEKLSKKSSRTKKAAAIGWEQHDRYGKWLTAYEEMFERTDTQWASWHQILATKRRTTTLQVYRSLLAILDGYVAVPDPVPGPEDIETS